MDDTNDSRSREFKPQDVMNTLGLRIIWTTQGYSEHEQKAVNVMTNLGL